MSALSPWAAAVLVELEQGRAICRVERADRPLTCAPHRSRVCVGVKAGESYVRVHAFTPDPTSVAVCVACARLLPIRPALVGVVARRNETASRYAGHRGDPATEAGAE